MNLEFWHLYKATHQNGGYWAWANGIDAFSLLYKKTEEHECNPRSPAVQHRFCMARIWTNTEHPLFILFYHIFLAKQAWSMCQVMPVLGQLWHFVFSCLLSRILNIFWSPFVIILGTAIGLENWSRILVCRLYLVFTFEHYSLHFKKIIAFRTIDDKWSSS